MRLECPNCGVDWRDMPEGATHFCELCRSSFGLDIRLVPFRGDPSKWWEYEWDDGGDNSFIVDKTYPETRFYLAYRAYGRLKIGMGNAVHDCAKHGRTKDLLDAANWFCRQHSNLIAWASRD